MFNLRAKFCFSIVLIFTMLFASCDKSKDISNLITGEDIPVIWCKDLIGNNGEISARTQFPFYNSTVMFGGTTNGLGTLVGLDIETGEQKWKYFNIDIPITSFEIPVDQYHFENRAYLLDDPYNHYFIDITTGEVEKIVSEEQCYGEQYGIGNSVFSITRKVDADGTFHFCLMHNDMSKSEPFEELLCPDYDFEHTTSANSYGYLSELDLFVSNGDTLILIGYNDAIEGDFDFSNFWSVYNLTNNEWEVEKEPIFEEYFGQITSVIEEDGLFYFAGDGVICIDRMTKEQEWSGQIYGDLSLVNDHEILLANTITLGEINAYDSKTGAKLWTYPNASKGSMHYQDDILYFIEFDGSQLHAINIQDGSEVWTLESPDDSTWLWQINGIPAQNGQKGKIFASTRTTGYCFEAVN